MILSAPQTVNVDAREGSPFLAEGLSTSPPPANAPAAAEAFLGGGTGPAGDEKDRPTPRRGGVLRNLSIRQKLVLGFAGAFGLMGIVVGIATVNLTVLSTRFDKGEILNRVSEQFHDVQILAKELNFDGDRSRFLAAKNSLHVFRQDAERELGKIRSAADSGTVADLIDAFAAFENAFNENRSLILQYQAVADDLTDITKRMHEAAIEISKGLDAEAGVRPTIADGGIEITRLTAEVEGQEKNFWLYRDRKYAVTLRQAIDRLIVRADGLKIRDNSPAIFRQLDKIGDTARAYRDGFVHLVDLDNQRESARLMMLAAMQRANAEIRRAHRSQSRDVLVRMAESRNVILAVSAMVLACGALWTWFVSRSVSRPAERIILAMEDLSMGNLNANLPTEDRRDEFGAMAALLRTFRDTEIQRRRLINASLRSQRASMESAETANRAKSEFLRSMSHELRTPMNAILGFSQLMASDTEKPLDEEQRENVDQIIKAGRHLLDLINEVLELNKIEAGAVRLSIENVKTESLIDECLSLIAPNADKRSIKINNRCDGACGLVVRADYTRLKQCLLNLLSNAVKYNWEGGKVLVDCAPVANNRLRISVTDTGPGIPADRQKELFQPFNRLGAETTEIEGTGIGLNVTKRLIELMSGSIGFLTKQGQGSTFWLEVPLTEAVIEAANASEQDPTVKQESAVSPANGGATILYVEDNPANLRLMGEILRKIPNVHMLAAPSPGLGLELAESREPDLILLDINLPGMSGYDVLKRLKKSRTTRDIPVLALSANAMPRDIEKGLRAGFDGYLTKPIDIAALTKAIGENIARAS